MLLSGENKRNKKKYLYLKTKSIVFLSYRIFSKNVRSVKSQEKRDCSCPANMNFIMNVSSSGLKERIHARVVENKFDLYLLSIFVNQYNLKLIHIIFDFYFIPS